jgi:tetratricopeptide (TPR) repeat protein
MEMDLIMKMSFFIRDLHDHIAKLHSKQYDGQTQSNPFTVYRGQGLLQADFDELRETQGGLMLFNNFIFASFDRATSLAFSESNQSNPDLVGVLFEITIDPSISSTSFANIHKVSAHPSDETILFAMQPVFRIGEIKQIEGLKNRLWQIDLTLTNDNDPQLRGVIEYIRKETFSGDKGWYRLGNLLIKLDQLSKAQQVFDIMLEQTIDQGEKAKLYHALGLINHTQGNNQEAIEYYEKSIEINEKILPPTHLSLANSYSDIGEVYNNMSKHSQALSYHEKALDIREKTLPANHPDLATSYSNIGEVYNNMTKYSEALSYYKKVLEIRQKASSVN